MEKRRSKNRLIWLEVINKNSRSNALKLRRYETSCKRGPLWPAPALPIVITLPSRSLLPCLCCVEYPYIRDELLKRSPHVTGSAVVVALQLLKQTQNRRRRRCSHSVSPPLNVTWRMLRAFGKRFSPPPFSGSLGPSLPPITDT